MTKVPRSDQSCLCAVPVSLYPPFKSCYVQVNFKYPLGSDSMFDIQR